jgi:hypothetical protein
MDATRMSASTEDGRSTARDGEELESIAAMMFPSHSIRNIAATPMLARYLPKNYRKDNLLNQMLIELA